MDPTQNDNSERDDLRSTLEEAFDNAGERQEGRSEADPKESVRTATEEAAPRQPREADGKYARKAGEKPAEKPDSGHVDGSAARPDVRSGDPAQKEAKPAPVDEFGKPPASWKAGARENWHRLPAEVRSEVYRRERETATVLQQSAEARQVAEQVQSLQQKYAPALNAEGVDLATATENLMDLAQRLRFGTPPEKATLVARLIQAYGVDIQTLDAVLSQQPIPQQAQAQQLRDPRVDGLLSQIAMAKQAQEQQFRAAAQQEVGEFGQQHEFFNDVRETMADIIELAARRGLDMPMEEAYKRACQMDPEISRVLAQRAAAGNAQNLRRSTERSKAASSSVRSTPVSGGAAKEPENLRGAIESAWNEAVGE